MKIGLEGMKHETVNPTERTIISVICCRVMLDKGLEKKKQLSLSLLALGTSDVIMPSDISRHSKFIKDG